MNIKVVEKNLLGALNKHAELKMKGICASHALYAIEILGTAILKR